MFVDMSINQRGRTAKKKTHMSSRRVSDGGRTKEVDGNHYLGQRLKMEEKSKTLTECKKNSSAISIVYLWVRASSPLCSHLDLGLFDSIWTELWGQRNFLDVFVLSSSDLHFERKF